jgi:hypothetical protein
VQHRRAGSLQCHFAPSRASAHLFPVEVGFYRGEVESLVDSPTVRLSFESLARIRVLILSSFLLFIFLSIYFYPRLDLQPSGFDTIVRLAVYI